MSTATGTDLVTNPATGEVLDLQGAETQAIAAVVDGVADLRGRLADFSAIAERELLDRLDRRASWTLRVGDPTGDVQYELKAPSPTAGTEGYDAAELERELATLVARATIDPDGAAAALERSVTVTVRVPFGHDLDELAEQLQDVDAIAGVPCTPLSVSVGRRVVAKGVQALRKVPGTGAALDRAAVTLTPPARKVRVKAIRREPRS